MLINIKDKCQKCGKIVTIPIDTTQYLEWKNGKLIQDALPELTDDEREFLISGICGTCYDSFFK